MKCYYHHENDAVAICKSCSRALCEPCAADVHPGTACVNRCEEDVEELNIVIDKSKASYQKAGKAYRYNAIAMLILGLIFVTSGIVLTIITGKYGAGFPVALGLVFLLWSYFSYRSAQQIEATNENT